MVPGRVGADHGEMAAPLRVLVFGAGLWASVPGPPAQVALAVPPEAPQDAAKCIPADKCCRICDKGKACGNSCISRKLVCHKGRGCACDASDLCASP